MDILSFLLGLTKGKSMTTAPGDVDKELDTINGEVIGEEEYTVTFLNYDGSFLYETVVNEGYNCPDPVSKGTISKPVKPNTRYIAYTYSGWSSTPDGRPSTAVLKNIHADTTVYAVFAFEYIYVDKGTYLETGIDTGRPYEIANISWTLNPDYVLTITGFGEIKAFEDDIGNGELWDNYRSQITSVEMNLGKNTTYYDAKSSTGYRLFQNCTALKSVRLSGNGLNNIGYLCFDGCTSLESVDIGEDVASNFYLSSRCFERTTNLKSIVFPESTIKIYGSSFNSSGLTSATLQTPTWYWILDKGMETPEVTQLTAEQVADTAYIAGLLTSGLNAQLSTRIV